MTTPADSSYITAADTPLLYDQTAADPCYITITTADPCYITAADPCYTTITAADPSVVWPDCSRPLCCMNTNCEPSTVCPLTVADCLHDTRPLFVHEPTVRRVMHHEGCMFGVTSAISCYPGYWLDNYTTYWLPLTHPGLSILMHLMRYSYKKE